ncbi:hypothetical protein RG47T_3918 [Mucilaginibacter polytrichastri]|uniref:Ig-like domain-containing protein n=2 Tax=Mucilaginibacter polytrichastri TaxID=1302689 RepID=A0A1Q6A377_9SPHI|nr:hypothetical protein RG47T_3918 [Mucilaginibacter polytrichastri]
MMGGITAKAQINTLAGLTGAVAVYCPAEQVKMLAASSGTTYAWLRYPGKDLTGTPVTLAGTTANLVDVPPAPGYYTYVSTSSNTNCTSDPSTPVVIYALPNITATVTGPAAACVSAIGTTVLTATAANTEATDTDVFGYTYQWSKNGTAITGATNTTYTLNATTDATLGAQAFTVSVKYIIRPACTTAVSNTQTVTVEPNPTKPTVTIVP